MTRLVHPEQNGDEARFARRRQLACKGPREAAVNRRRPPHAARKIDDVDGKIIGRKDQKADAGEERQLGRDPREEFGSIHHERAVIATQGARIGWASLGPLARPPGSELITEQPSFA